MIHEMVSAMTAAGRVGYEVGRQIQVDNAINDWARYADGYRSQRDDAWHQIRTLNARLTECQQENQSLRSRLKACEQQKRELQAQIGKHDQELGRWADRYTLLCELRLKEIGALRMQIEKSKLSNALR